MKLTKTLTIGLLLAAALSFASCTGNKDVTGGNSNQQTGNEQEQKPETPEEKENEENKTPATPEDDVKKDPEKPSKKEYSWQLGKVSDYEADVSIKVKNINEGDNCYTNKNGVITFTAATPVDETKDIEVSIKGHFKGQIVNQVKGLVITLNNAYLENEDAAVIVCEAKTEISAKKETTNYIVSTKKTETEEPNKIGAVYSKDKNIKLGGSGTCIIVGNIYHGIKADKVEFKGSGKYYLQGTKKGSAVNCDNFEIEPADPEDPKTVSVYMCNAKNGIKADKSISIKNGKLYFYGHETALKTNTAAEGQEKSTTITLSDCSISTKDVDALYETDTCSKSTTVKEVKITE